MTAGLVNAKPARVAYAPRTRSRSRASPGGRAEVHVTPAKQGVNVADVHLVQRNGTLFIPPEVKARLRDKEITLPVELAPAEPGHHCDGHERALSRPLDARAARAHERDRRARAQRAVRMR